MFLIQLASAEDKPLKNIHKSPCSGLVLRGSNLRMDANLQNRHETMSTKDPNFS